MQSGLLYIKKRSGRLEKFLKSKIENAIFKAMVSQKVIVERVKKRGKGLRLMRRLRGMAERLAEATTRSIEKKFKGRVPHVEDVQDEVERQLIRANLPAVAKAYILYREEHKNIRLLKKFFGVEDRLKLTENAALILEKRYLKKDVSGKVIETPEQMFRRVAKAVAFGESKEKQKYYEEQFYVLMRDLKFLPNSPALMNAGLPLNQLAACFVLPIDDSIDSIFLTLKHTAAIFQSGGGVGINFSNIRTEGSLVSSTMGNASGPVSFMKIFDKVTEVIKSGGKRRGALIGILDVSHPDIRKFVSAKTHLGELENFNLSVAVTDSFMNAVINNKRFPLIDPHTKKIVRVEYARDLFDFICANAWQTGDPGLIFIDTINKQNPLKRLGKIESTNPCSEAPLFPYESCVLGSINLSRMVRNKHIDWVSLEKTIKLAVRFLDDIITVNNYPLDEIKEQTLASRKIGLGVMGFAEMLILLGIPYNSEEAIKTAEKLMQFIRRNAVEASCKLAKEKGEFKNFKYFKPCNRHWGNKFYNLVGGKGWGLRNATVLSIAPTGTISIIANTSSSIEPIFAVSYVREILGGARMIEVNHIFEEELKERNIYSKELLGKIAKQGTLKNVKLPSDLKKLFVTAHEISPDFHLRIQSVVQKYVDNAVSKTINLRESATIEDIKEIFIKAWKFKCKGITVYRYNSKPRQVLYFSEKDIKGVRATMEYSGGCLNRECIF